MSESIYRNLSWLLPPDDRFAQFCKELLASSEPAGARLRCLANAALDENQLSRLARTYGKLKEKKAGFSPLTPFRLALIGNCTTSFIGPALVGTALRHGIALDFLEGGFNQAVQDATQADSAICQFKPDAVLVFLDYRALFAKAAPGNPTDAENSVNAALNFIEAIRAGLKRNTGAACIFQTIARTEESIFGSLDRSLAGTTQQMIEEFNARLRARVRGTEDLLMDLAGLAETVGLASWLSPVLWNYGKVPFDSQYIPLYADHVCRLIAALRGKARRCLILDLDNTLWSGVIGDDGLEGIVLGQGHATGEAHLALQRVALELRERGVVLAVCSKNTDEVARRPFREHPDMLIREEHIAVFQANWQDKATNIQAIAASLNLGLESLVFVDDNPAERDVVRKHLPEVAVPELPEDPAYYVRTVLAAGYFEAHGFSNEDRERASYYTDNARRVTLQQQAGDMESFLKSLNMVMTLSPFDEVGRARISQLINKSNQFNLTTRRYTEPQVKEIQEDPSCFHLQCRLVDSFGDNGMISVVICRETDREWHVDTWLMSCRVLGRKVEQALLAELLSQARARGISRIRGTYIPTDRNALVRNHYDGLGFTETGRSADGTCHYLLNLSDHVAEALPIQIVRRGLAENAAHVD